MSFISVHGVCWTRLSGVWWRFNRLVFFLFASSKKQEAPGNTDSWVSTRYINVHHLRFNIMSYLYGLMSLRDRELRVFLSKQFNYSCFLDLFWFMSSELRFKSAPLNISRWLHIGDCLSVCLYWQNCLHCHNIWHTSWSVQSVRNKYICRNIYYGKLWMPNSLE
jgi:hypothetical protein